MSMKLRPYQKKNSKEVLDLLNEGKDVIYQLPTGGGKTVIINDIVEKVLKGKAKFTTEKILILIHRREIIFQMYERLIDSGIDAGYLIGMKKKNVDAQVLIGSIQTIANDKRLEKVLEDSYDFIVIDEAHHSRSGSYDKVLHTLEERNPNMRLLGVTATPNRNDKKALTEHFQVMVKGPSIEELQEMGYLSKSVTYLADLKDLEEVVESNGNDYKMAELSAYMRNDTVIEHAIKLYEDKAPGQQMLVFCVDKSHLDKVEQAYKKAGYNNVASITAETSSSDRAQIIKKYKQGKIDIVFSIETLTEGTDLPDTKVVQLLRPTKSQELYLQIVGRGLRVKEDGSHLIVLDIANCSKEHGLCDSNRHWSLDKKTMQAEKNRKIVVGRRGDGTYTDDIEEISINGLIVEEMTREEFILKSTNAIEASETNNYNIKKEVAKMINQTGEEIAKMLPGKWVFRKFDVSDVDEKMEYNRLKFYLGNLQANESVYLTIEDAGVLKEKKDVVLKENRYAYRSIIPQMDWWVILGKLVEVVRTKRVKALMATLWAKAAIKFENLVDIQAIKELIESTLEAQIETKLENAFAQGKFVFEFEEDFWGETYNRNFWRRGNKIEFVEQRPRLKNSQKVKFNGYEGGLKKEDVIRMFKNEKPIW